MTLSERGFTVLEMLVAMAILSLGAVALLNLAGENTRTAAALRTRLFASIVADNRAIEAIASAMPPSVGAESGVEMAGGEAWRWTRRVTRAADSDILRVTVTVSPPQSNRTASEVVVFRVMR
jgi:general secretion pathway protein I